MAKNNKYGELPGVNDPESITWYLTHVELVDNWDVQFKIRGELAKQNISTLTIVGAAKSCPYMIQITNYVS